MSTPSKQQSFGICLRFPQGEIFQLTQNTEFTDSGVII